MAKKKVKKKNISKKVTKPVKSSGKLIMVVDDEEDVRNTTKTALEANGFKVVTANNADGALKKLQTCKPALILLDIMMPGTPVREAVPKMKGKIMYLSVVRTSEAEKEDLMKSKNIVGFIQKPFDIDNLVAKVKSKV